MKIKLSRLKQIIQEVIEEKYASERMDDIMQSTREEEVDPHDQQLDEMIAEEIEAAMGQLTLEEEEVQGGEEQGAGEEQGGEEQEEKAMAAVEKVLAYLPGIKTRHAYAQLFQRILKHPVKDKAMAIKAATNNKIATVIMDELGEK
jgi:hypothetical protein